jgi:two-component system, OmpR family, sensor kinase
MTRTIERRTLKLRTGLALQLLTLLAFALFFLSWFVVRQTQADLIDQVDQSLKGAIAGRVRDAATPPPPPNKDRTTVANLPPTATVVFDPTGRELSFAASGVNGKLDPRPQLDGRAIRKNVGQLLTVNSANRAVRFRVISGQLANGNIVVEVAPLRLVDSAVHDIIGTLAIGSLLVLTLAGFALYVLVRRALAPLAVIAQSANTVASGDIQHGVGITTRYTELNQLSNSLSSMVSQLGTAFDAQTLALKTEEATNKRLRQFVADASHELQTPVTSIRGWAELYRKGGLRDTSAQESALVSIEREATRMGRLVDDLLSLTRADEQRLASRMPVNLKLICDDAIETAKAVDDQRSVDFLTDTSTDLSAYEVMGDIDQLRRVLDNLLANVRIHTAPDTKAKVSLSAEAGHVVVMVSDDGPGIDPNQIPHVFDRFWRAEHNRNDSHGLGLSIVQSIIEAHDGTVTASNQTTGHGAVITVTLPSTGSIDSTA